MTVERIDLYGHFGVPRGAANGGYLTAYVRTERAVARRRVRPAMLVLPGGGYYVLSDSEAEPVALKWAERGFAAFLLEYSVSAAYPTPLVEAMLATAYIRENCERYSVDAQRVCAVGFSAGGHLAGLLATVSEKEAALVGRTASAVRPDAAVMSYAVATMGEYTHAGTRDIITGGDGSLEAALSVEKRVGKDSSPMFLWHTFEDDLVPVQNALAVAAAYANHGVPFSLHIFEKGWHGLSIANGEIFDGSYEPRYLYDAGKWFELAVDWLDARGIRLTII